MRTRPQLFGLSGLLVAGVLSSPAFAQGLTDTEEDPRQSTEKPKEAEQPTAVLPSEPVPPPSAPVVEPAAKTPPEPSPAKA